MKLAISYFIGIVLETIVIGFVKDPIIAFVFFMSINIVTAIITTIVTIIGGFNVQKK